MGSNWICKCKSSSMDSSAAVILLIRCKRPIACVYNDYEVLFLMYNVGGHQNICIDDAIPRHT